MFWFLHLIECCDGLLNDQEQKYTSFGPTGTLDARKRTKQGTLSARKRTKQGTLNGDMETHQHGNASTRKCLKKTDS